MQIHSLFLISGAQWGQLFAALSLLILLHEFGHYFFAKLFKTRVEKFYLFFDFLFPFSGLLNFSLFKKKVGDTEYGLGWFPLGGYVKIAGMVDESMDKEQMERPPEPWEYRSKPAWQRLLIMLGGIIMNVLVAMIVYMAVFSIWGEQYLPTANATYGIATDSLARTIGLRDGDKIISVGGKPVERFNHVVSTIILEADSTMRVERDGQVMDISLPKGTIRKILKGQKGLIAPRIPTVVEQVMEKTPAEQMKLQPGDSIVSVNGRPVFFLHNFLQLMDSMKGQPIRLGVIRNGSQFALLNGAVGPNGKLGFQAYSGERFLQIRHIRYSPLEAAGKGISFTWQQFGMYLKQFKMIFVSPEVKASESLGGIASFGKLFPSEFDWQTFLMLVAFVSIILAFMNLLPIPGLDGGYVIFLLFELITRRKVSDKVMEYATTVGLVLLLALMVYANGLDIFRYFDK